MSRMLHPSPWILAVATALAAGGATAEDPTIPIYIATYQVEYDGKQVGTSQFKVQFDESRGVYEFSTHTTVKGLLKLARPNPVIERSQFRIEGGHIRPLESWYEDGSRKGEDNVHMVFDWQKRVAVAEISEGRREIALQDGALDRASLQVALMRDLDATGKPGSYFFADTDGIKAYEYTDNGAATTATGLGELATRSLVQHRPGSSRTTWLWMAPQLKFLPARIEQRRDGETQTAFTLTSVEGLGR